MRSRAQVNRIELAGATVALLLGSMLVVACGRSAPEDALGQEDGSEPVTAGVQVVSDEPVVVPPPTSATTAPTTATTAMAQPGGSYVVEPGDTLSAIAARFGVTVDALSQANGITDVNTITPGQELVIPPG